MFELVFCFLCSLLMPVVMLTCGGWFVTSPPDDINGLVGYKTRMSVKNGDTWAYAHRVSGICWIVGGILSLICSFALAYLLISGQAEGDSCYYVLMAVQGIQLFLLLAAIPITEHMLKRRFNPDGTYKR